MVVTTTPSTVPPMLNWRIRSARASPLSAAASLIQA